MIELLHRETSAPVVSHDVDARTVTVRLCRWNEPREVTDPTPAGLHRYREAFPPGSIELAPDVHVVDHHHGDLIGRANVDSWHDDGTGPTVELTLARTAAANDTLALIEAGVIRAVSMEVEPLNDPLERDGVLWRTLNRVHGIAFAFRPAHDAPILATREQHQENMTMTDDARPGPPPTSQPAPQPAPQPPADPADTAVSVAVLERSMSELRDDLHRTLIAEAGTLHRADPLEGLRHRSLGHYAEAVWNDPANPVLRRALADQITDNNPGVVPPGWLSTVYGILDFGRPTIAAFGTMPLPDTGMEIDWPYFDGDMMALVGEQLTEKTSITTVRVDLKKGSELIRTFAGGSDVSYQLIRRSGPAYLGAYLRIMSIAYAAVTNGAAAADVVAAATASSASWDPSTGDLADLATALFVASVEVESATGMPAEFVLCASDVFIAAGALAVQTSTDYGTQNVPGQASARTLRPSVAGLPLIHDGSLATGTMIVSNSEAGGWASEGPFTVTAEDVERLGQNVAVWGMGAMALPMAGGIIKVNAT